MVPHRCCNRFVRWRQAGVWDRIMDALADRSRRESAQPTTAAAARNERRCNITQNNLQPARMTKILFCDGNGLDHP
jgi:transposase